MQPETLRLRCLAGVAVQQPKLRVTTRNGGHRQRPPASSAQVLTFLPCAARWTDEVSSSACTPATVAGRYAKSAIAAPHTRHANARNSGRRIIRGHSTGSAPAQAGGERLELLYVLEM